MCFGAAASVWNFNRTADALQALMRVLLWVLSGHFVDDFNGVDVDGLAEGAFGGMAEFLELLGLQTKPSKAQKPAKEHIIQGVLVAITSDGVVLRPTPARVKKITQSTFGAVRKAALQPVYARGGRRVGYTAVGRPQGGPVVAPGTPGPGEHPAQGDPVH